MADADDKLDFCRQALGEIGTRSTITSLDPPDSSPEAYYCNLFFNGTRDQVLRAAHWNFAGRSDLGVLWKAKPGTPENPDTSSGYQWSVRDPAAPWSYSYLYPGGIYSPVLQIRRIRSQQRANPGADLNNIPFYPGTVFGGDYNQCVPFEVATDEYNQAGNHVNETLVMTLPVIVSAGTGYRPGDYVTLTGGGSVYGNPASLLVITTTTSGAVQQLFLAGIGGSFTVAATGPMTQLSTTGNGSGLSITGTFVPGRPIVKIVLTNANDPIFDFTTSLVEVIDYDPMFADAFMLALEGKLALALLGDRALYGAKLQEANNSILNARVRDGNEGLTTYDHVPDWLQVRGVASMGSPGNWYNPPYGPLFAV